MKVPKDITRRRDGVTVKFQDDAARCPKTASVARGQVRRAARPAFAFNYQVVDNWTACNGDGVVQRGET